MQYLEGEKSWQEQRSQRKSVLQQEKEHLLAQQEKDELDRAVVAKRKSMDPEKYGELFAAAKEATIKKYPLAQNWDEETIRGRLRP